MGVSTVDGMASGIEGSSDAGHLGTLDITVSDPQKRTGDQGSYVSYQISTKTQGARIVVVHRRFSDLQLLHDYLAEEHPTCVVPPLPEKKVLVSITSDRFSQRFTAKRCHSLQNFLRRVAAHEALSRSDLLRSFLMRDEEWDRAKRSLVSRQAAGGGGARREEVTDAFMNAFKSVHAQSDECVEVRERNDRLDRTVGRLDRTFHKVVKRNDVLVDDLARLGTHVAELRELEGTHTSGKQWQTFNEALTRLSYGVSDLNKYLDYELLVDLRDLEHYIDSLRQQLKLKDQKQIDYEQLSEYLTKAVRERDQLIAGYGGHNFFTNKLEEFAGVNQEAARREKITKLEGKISSLGGALESAKQVADAFELETLREVAQFERVRTQELKRSLGELADHHIEFYEQMLETWTAVDAELGG
ncbi:Snx4p KNAG_0F02640 [Huiozyma naganishii CBS 8797]|uniref:Sorting nexin-4 n=1 Tax=Huiozyma naganishii (strain ATCC MYA-139 / BCRC 22969 / CBS 8797 / KCTC 17520 / NBRC 10181 / NCYC 3082 / Yp74L-3) TaxID=1071383 RepID=J7RMZ3_HUIN7|nr:hypothetical protein KNAG_0F02640 [Kazachstania naganishii CBS 8797]CCK70928.1 hypothetical protein KNAG_0F02640 [Kazachstania naganishii CBS 8797]